MVITNDNKNEKIKQLLKFLGVIIYLLLHVNKKFTFHLPSALQVMLLQRI